MKTVIFDMDGVLIDSEIIYINSKNMILANEGVLVENEYHFGFMGMNYFDTWKKLKADHNLKFEIEFYIKEMLRIKDDIIESEGIKPIKHVVPFVNKLHENNVTLAVASSSPHQTIIEALDSLRIKDKFKIIVGGDEVANSKPAPDIFLLTAELLNENPKDCLVIEDSINGILAAKAAQMHCLHFKNEDYKLDKETKADFTFQDFNALENIFF